MLCHSVRSCHSPALFLNRSLVAMLNFATGVPLGVYLTSGSFPRFPIKMTLLTLLDTMVLLQLNASKSAVLLSRRHARTQVHNELFRWDRFFQFAASEDSGRLERQIRICLIVCNLGFSDSGSVNRANDPPCIALHSAL